MLTIPINNTIQTLVYMMVSTQMYDNSVQVSFKQSHISVKGKISSDIKDHCTIVYYNILHCTVLYA